MKSIVLLFVILLCLLPAFAQDEEETYRPCVSAVMPGQQGKTLYESALYEKPDIVRPPTLRMIPEGTIFTALEGPVCLKHDEGWLKIEYQEEGQTYQGWFIVLIYWGCDRCTDDPPSPGALALLAPMTVVPADDHAALPPTTMASNALTPDTISQLTLLTQWGDGSLQDIGWTDDGLLRVFTSHEERQYDPLSMRLQQTTQHPWISGTMNTDGSLVLVRDPLQVGKLIVRETKTQHDLVVLDGDGGVFDATGRYLAINLPPIGNPDESTLIRVYDMTQPDQPVIVQSFTDVGRALLFKDHWLLSANDWTIYALDIETASVSSFQDGMSGRFGGARLSPDGRWLALLNTRRMSEMNSSTVTEMLMVYSISDLPPSSVLSYLFLMDDLSNSSQTDQTIDYAWSPDSQTLFVTTDHGQIAYGHRPEDGYFEQIWTLNVPDVKTVDYNPDGSLIALTTKQNEVHLYHETEPIGVLTNDEILGPISKIIFSPDGRWLAAADARTHVTIWDVPLQQRTSGLALKNFDLFHISPDETTLQTDRRIYELETGNLFGILPPDQALKPGPQPSNQIYETTIQRDPFGQTSVSLQNPITDKIVQTFERIIQSPTLIRLSPDGQTMLVLDQRTSETGDWEDGAYLLLYDVASRDLLDVEFLGEMYFKGSDLSNDGNILFWTMNRNQVSEGGVYDFTTRSMRLFPLEDDQINPGYITLNADGSLAFLTTIQKHLTVWDTKTGQQIAVPALDAITVGQKEVSQDGSRLYMTDGEGQFFIWGLPQ